MIRCQICQKHFLQISASHLKSHNLTMAEYRNTFPGSETVSNSVKEKISKKHSGVKKSLEHKSQISQSIQRGFENGRVIHNKGLKGEWRTQSDSEKMMRSEAAKHRPPMSEETKQKIREAHKGKKMPTEWVKRMRQNLKSNPPRSMLGKKHTEESKLKMRSIIDRPAWEQYELDVNRISNPIREELRKMGIEFGSKNNLDHIIPKIQGFKENIPAEIIGSIANLQILSESENKIKGSKLASSDLITTIYSLFDEEIDISFIPSREKIIF